MENTEKNKSRIKLIIHKLKHLLRLRKTGLELNGVPIRILSRKEAMEYLGTNDIGEVLLIEKF